MAGTISIRLQLTDALQLKQQLESVGTDGGAALDKVRTAIERLGAQDTSAVSAALARIRKDAQDTATAVAQAQANSFAGVAAPTSADNYAARARDIAAYGASLDALRAKYSPLYAASKSYEATLDEIAQAEKVGALSANEAAAARDTATAAFAKSSAPVAAATAGLKSHAEASGAAAASMRGLGIQVVQGLSGIATGQPILTTFVQQGHQIVDQSLAMGTGFRGIADAGKGLLSAIGGLPTLLGVGLVGALGAMAVAANSNANHLADLRESLRLTHTDYGTLADAVDASARRVAASSVLTRSSAEEIGKTIASSRYLGTFANDLDALTKSAADYARVAGVDGPAAGKLFRQAIDDPAAAVKVLAEQGLPGFDGAMQRTVQNLANTGNAAGATRAILDLLGKDTQGAAKDASPLAQAMHDLNERFFSASAGSKSLGENIGSLLDRFAAHELHGLDKFIEGLQGISEKAGTATQKILEMQGTTDDLGRTIPDSAVGTAASRAASGSALGQVDASLRPIVQAAAAQYQLDADLLARLQLAENRTPTGYSASGTAIYRASGEDSPNAAVGAFQIKPSTYAGLGFTGDPSDNTNNTNAAAKHFGDLLTKYGDVRVAVLAYHDGEPVVDKMLAGSGSVSQAALDEATKVTSGYSGSGRPAGATQLDPVTVTAAKATGAGTQYGPPSPYSEATQRLLNEAPGGTQAETAEDAANRIKVLSAAIDELNAKGQGGSAAMSKLKGELENARTAAYGAVPTFTAITRASQDSIAPLTAQSGAARTVATAVNEARIALQAKGQTLTDVQADQVRTDALTKLGLAFNDNVAAVDRQIAAQTAINQVYAASGGNILQITAQTQAEASARETAIPGTKAYADQVAILTDRNVKLAQSQLYLSQLQQNKGVENDIAYIQAETATLGLNEDARTRVLAVMKAEQAEHLKYGAILPQEAQDYVNLIGKQADYAASLKNQQASYSELTTFVDNTFSTISDSIVSAFATGEQSAVKFQDVVGSVVKAIEAEFLKLAIVNPLKNLLFGSTSPTLSSVGGILGNLLGNVAGGATSSASGGSVFDAPLTAAAGVGGGDFDGAGSTLSVGTLVAGGKLASSLGDATGLTGGSTGGFLAGFADKITDAVTGAIGNSTEALNIAADAGNFSNTSILAASVSNALGVSNETAATIASAAGSIAEALPYVGAAVSVVTSLINGDYRGAAITGGLALTGAYIGSLVGSPGIGTAIGAAAGALISAILPNHPLHPYSNVDLNIAGGQLTTANGYDVAQLSDLNADKAGVQSYADSINTYLQHVGLVITNADVTLGHIGTGITGMVRAGLTTGQTADPSTLFKYLSFGAAPDDKSTFGIAKGALQGMSFNSPVDLQNELYKIAGFADAVDALGIHLKAVGTDLTNIQIASVDLGNVDGPGQNNTTTVQDDQGRSLTYLSDIRTALNADLPTQTFANIGAIDTEIQKVTTFLGSTLPTLLTPMKITQSSLQDQVQASNQRYADAMAQSRAYGLDNDAPLSTARDRAIEIIMKPALDALNTTLTSIVGRGQTALYGQTGTSTATLNNLAQTQSNEQSQLYDTIHQTFGDNAVATGNFNAALQQLLITQNAETQATKQQLAISQAQGLAGILATEATNAQSAGIDGLNASLRAFDAKAAEQRLEFIKSWTDYYGQAAAGSQDLQDQLLIMDKASAAQRLQVQQQYSDASTAALKQAQGSVTNLFGDIKSYVLKLETGSQSSLSPTSQYDLASSQFRAVYGAAAAGDANSAQQLTSYADALLSTSQAVNGSGAAYAADFSSVLDALRVVGNSADALTQGFMAQQLQSQTDAIAAAQNATTDAVNALRRELQQLTRAQAA